MNETQGGKGYALEGRGWNSVTEGGSNRSSTLLSTGICAEGLALTCLQTRGTILVKAFQPAQELDISVGKLRGPVAILFISRVTCSNSIAKLLRACFMGYRTIIARYVARWGIAQMCLCETKYQGGGIAPLWVSASLPEKVLRDIGYRSDSIAVSRDMGPLSWQELQPARPLLRDGKTHKRFQHKLFAPHPNCTIVGPPETKVYVPHFLGKNAKKGPT